MGGSCFPERRGRAAAFESGGGVRRGAGGVRPAAGAHPEDRGGQRRGGGPVPDLAACQGHDFLTDIPGVGKTTLAKAISQSIASSSARPASSSPLPSSPPAP